MTNDEIQFAFRPVAPGKMSEKQKMCVQKISTELEDLARTIVDLVPGSADRSHGLRLLLDLKFWCVQAITHEKEEKNVTTTSDGRIQVLEARVEALTAALEARPEVSGTPVAQGSTVIPNRQ